MAYDDLWPFSLTTVLTPLLRPLGNVGECWLPSTLSAISVIPVIEFALFFSFFFFFLKISYWWVLIDSYMGESVHLLTTRQKLKITCVWFATISRESALLLCLTSAVYIFCSLSAESKHALIIVVCSTRYRLSCSYSAATSFGIM